MSWFLVFIGGGAGSICRYYLAQRLNYTGQEFVFFPAGTFLANLVSCLILGVLVHRQLSHNMGESWRLLFITGFCGGFSTFSTFIYELQMYTQRGQLKLGFTYVLTSIVLGLLALMVGYKLSSMWS